MRQRRNKYTIWQQRDGWQIHPHRTMRSGHPVSPRTIADSAHTGGQSAGDRQRADTQEEGTHKAGARLRRWLDWRAGRLLHRLARRLQGVQFHHVLALHRLWLQDSRTQISDYLAARR